MNKNIFDYSVWRNKEKGRKKEEEERIIKKNLEKRKDHFIIYIVVSIIFYIIRLITRLYPRCAIPGLEKEIVNPKIDLINVSMNNCVNHNFHLTINLYFY